MNLKNKFQKFKQRYKEIISLKNEYKKLYARYKLAILTNSNTYVLRRKLNMLKADYKKIKFWFNRSLK